jgi:hypothetical protein
VDCLAKALFAREPQTFGQFAKQVLNQMGQFLTTQPLSHDDKGLCIFRPGSASSVLVNSASSLAMQYEDPEERNHSLGTRPCHFLHVASPKFWPFFNIVI